MAETRLRKINNFLTVVVVLLGFFITVSPFIPELMLQIRQSLDDTNGYVYRSALASETLIDDSELAEAPTDNRLVIPAIQLNEPIIVGDNPGLVDSGAWHRPRTSTPDKGGNTVIVGHRFSYASPATFYHLDKMRPGDKFDVWWNGKEYIYEVFEVIIVDATEVSIEGTSEDPIMTLYTCTPIWTSVDRLVVRANLVNLDVLAEAN